jgi:predicted RNase H-like HicB family nuclease
VKQGVKDYLKLPYTREIIPDLETGTFTGLIREFPGCVTQGDTPSETYEFLEDVAASWIEAALRLGQSIPQPTDDGNYSGKVALRLPRSLHGKAAQAAKRDGVSLNQFIVTAIAESTGESRARTEATRSIYRVLVSSYAATSSTEAKVFTIQTDSDGNRLRSDVN